MSLSPHGPVLVVANPRSGKGKGAAIAETSAALAASGVEHRIVETRGAGDATRIARQGVQEEGFRFVVAVGGDGTVHEVVNGLVDAETGEAVGEDLVLGVLPGGSGCDFMKTFGLDSTPIDRLVERHLLTETTFPLDVGRVRYRAPDGSTATRVFANIAECGWGGDVTRRANRMPRFVGKARYLGAILISTAALRAVETEVTVDHTSTREPMTEIVVANGQFFGSGIKVAPRALPDDGTFNVQTWRGGVRELLENLPKARVGEHLTTANVREWQSRTVSVDAVSPLTLEADGEILGTTPAEFEVLPSVLRISA